MRRMRIRRGRINSYVVVFGSSINGAGDLWLLYGMSDVCINNAHVCVVSVMRSRNVVGFLKNSSTNSRFTKRVSAISNKTWVLLISKTLRHHWLK